MPENKLILNIIGKANGVGLTRDLDLLSSSLTACGHEVHIARVDADGARRRRSVWSQVLVRSALLWKNRSRDRRAVDVNIMLEHIWTLDLGRARYNVVIPNPEWFDSHDRNHLSQVDAVWAKTEYTLGLFRARHAAAVHVGFDSEDRYDSAVPRQRTFFHLAGKSNMKGTERLLQLWARHPEWPLLRVVQHSPESHAPGIVATNVQRLVGYFDDAELLRLQNASLFHICTSLTEGWGHYIAEGLSVGAVVITVDGAPMNELVTAERGVLVPYQAMGRQRLATTYLFDEQQLEAAVTRVLALSEPQCKLLGERSRTWFLQNKQTFPDRLRAALEQLRLPIASPAVVGRAAGHEKDSCSIAAGS